MELASDAEEAVQQVARRYASFVANPTAAKFTGDETQDYAQELLELVPQEVFATSCGGGNPFGLRSVEVLRGARVVDLGCGAGADVCLAAVLAGAGGHVLGVDVNPTMLLCAEENWARVQAAAPPLWGLATVEFLAASFDKPDDYNLRRHQGNYDVVLSNGTFNLSFDKSSAFVTAFMLLRPGGVFQLFDIVLEDGTGLPEESLPTPTRAAGGV